MSNLFWWRLLIHTKTKVHSLVLYPVLLLNVQKKEHTIVIQVWWLQIRLLECVLPWVSTQKPQLVFSVQWFWIARGWSCWSMSFQFWNSSNGFLLSTGASQSGSIDLENAKWPRWTVRVFAAPSSPQWVSKAAYLYNLNKQFKWKKYCFNKQTEKQKVHKTFWDEPVSSGWSIKVTSSEAQDKNPLAVTKPLRTSNKWEKKAQPRCCVAIAIFP